MLKRLPGHWVSNEQSEYTMKKHIELLGILHLVYSGLALAVAVFCFALMSGIGFLTHDALVMGILGTIGMVVCVLITVLAIPGIVAGIGLLKMKSWGRVVAIIVGCLNLLHFPFGTALGVYTFWVLLNDESRNLLS
jgi:hypothetical protein